MHCNGKCHLQKEIKKVADEESQSSKTPTALKISVFQEVPVASMRLGRLYQLSVVNRIKLRPINYCSPTPEIASPPPKVA
jgi:hypothetical protein